MIESLRRGFGEILYSDHGNILVYDRKSKVCMVLAGEEDGGEKLIQLAPSDTELFLVSQEFMRELLLSKGWLLLMECSQYLYTAKETLPVRYKEIRPLTMEQFEYVCRHYSHDSADYVKNRISSGFLYGAFDGDRIVGFAGMHEEGSMGLLYVDEDYRRRGIAEALEAYVANRMLERSWIPYGHVVTGNEASEKLQEKLKFYKADQKVWWIERRKEDADLKF